MYAKSLQTQLSTLCQRSDMSRGAPDEMLVRFEKLRGSAALPRGRERRHQLLTAKEVGGAVLGLVPPNPNWAGHAFSVLRNLSPVGGLSASFRGKATLLQVIEELLTAREARQQLIRLMISGAESGTNSTGQAMLIYEAGGTVRVAYYVPRQAVSKLESNAETEFDGDYRDSPLSREVSFNPRFFDQLAAAMEMAKALPPPTDDGSEYDAEDARKELYKRLGVTSSSRFLHIGVDNQVTWPQHETLVTFDRYRLIMLPKTRDHVQSIHVDLVANRLTSQEAMTVVNRFLSIMAWCDDQFAIAGDGWSGNPNPVPVPRRNLAFTAAREWLFDRRIPDSDEVRRALALYREARNAQQNFMVSYAVLNFVKVIEVRHPGKNPVKNWFRDNFNVLRQDPQYKAEFDRFAEICGSERPHEYIHKACRVAVAHAGEKIASDPDIADELTRLHKAADILRLFARHLIKAELGVSEVLYSGD